MGDYRYPDEQVDDSLGIIRTSDGAFLSNPGTDEATGAWNAYLAWKAVPNTADAASAPAIADVRDDEKSRIDHEADAQFLLDLPAGIGSRTSAPSILALALAYLEAQRWERHAWAQIEVEGNVTAQMVLATTWEPFESFDTNGVASANALADQANDKIVTGAPGVYRLTATADVAFSVAAKDVSIRITVAGTAVPGAVALVHAENSGQKYSLAVSAVAEVATADQDVKLEIWAASIGSLTIDTATLSLEKIAELDAAASYPILDALEPNQGASIDAVAAALVAEWDAIKVRFGDVEDARRLAHDDMDAAGTVAAVRAVTASFPAP